MVWLMMFGLMGIALSRPTLRASDVVFMYVPSEASLYDAYAGTVVGWAGRASSRQSQHVEWFRQRVGEAKRHNLRYCGSVDFLVDFAGFIDFRPDTFPEAVCRDLEGKPITVPWLWDHRHKGHPAYWFCTNNPDYRDYLRDQVERACLAPIDGLHIDDWRGTAGCSAWNGGCFCKACKEGFRQWLRQHLSPEQQRQLGISDLDAFDIQDFLRGKGITAEQWRRERWRLPFGDLFQQFQTEQMLRVVREVFEYAERLVGHPLLRSVNSSASSPEALVVAPLVDFFCGEMEHYASKGQVPLEPAFVFRLVEGLGKRQVATAAGHDWAWIAANEKPGLVRTWIAQSYAFGSLFMVPHHQWCYNAEKGTHWWEGKTEDFAFVYRFVRANARLLDDYKPLADLALIYTNANFEEIRSASLELLKANVPFAILVAEPSLGVSLTQRDLSSYRWLIRGKEPSPVEGKEGSKGISMWRGLGELPKELQRQVLVEGASNVRISLRYNPRDPKAPVVCHLLNQDYDVETDEVRPTDVKVTLSEALLRKALHHQPREVVLHLPNKPPQRIPLERRNGAVQFAVPHLGFWAIVAIQ